jgi:hypothetical protein
MSLVPLAFSVTHKTSATSLMPCFTVTNTVGQWPLHFSFFAAFYMGHLNSKAFFLTSLLMKINNFQSSGSLPIYTTIWTSTMNKKSTNIFTTRATLKPSVMLLRKTRCSSAAKQNKI